MARSKKLFVIILSLVITTSCNKPNVLTEYSRTDSDDALFLDAKKKMDNMDWNGAISILTTQLSPAYRTHTNVKEALMHSYGGKCGISFFDLVNSLKNVTSTKMFEFSLQIFGGRVIDTASCDNAFNTLLSLGANSTLRTNSQNLFAAILGLTKMSTNLHAKFDTEFSGLGNGIVDAGWDSCPTSSAAARLSDAEVNKVVSGVGLIFENLAVLGAELTSGSAGASLTSALNSCESVMGVGNCTIVNEALVSPEVRRLFRRMISSSAMGFGTCNIQDMGVPPYTADGIPDCCPGIANP